MAVATPKVSVASVHAPQRAPQTSDAVPPGVNLLRSGRATLTVGGTRAWGSRGLVQVTPAELTNGATDEVETPWLPSEDVYWDGIASRQVWAEIDFAQPSDVHSLTVYENPRHADSWPTESCIQVWDVAAGRWRTVRHAAFLRGPVNSYSLDLKHVTKLRYLPWSSMFRNFYTSEIEVR
jgi:hypothetical protein